MINTKQTNRGFTLVELMIAVAVVVIITSVALPNYAEYTRRAARTGAQSQLLLAASFLERAYTTTGSYPTTLPTNVSSSPESGKVQYNITVATNPPANNTFTLTATAVGDTAGDKCGNFVLASTGEKSLVGNTLPIDQCWRR